MSADLRQSEILPLIRTLVRERLAGSQAFAELPADKRRAIAHDTVKAIAYIVGGPDGKSRPDSVSFAGESPITRQLAQADLPEGETAGQRFAQAGAVAAQQGSQAFTEMVSRV